MAYVNVSTEAIKAMRDCIPEIIKSAKGILFYKGYELDKMVPWAEQDASTVNSTVKSCTEALESGKYKLDSAKSELYSKESMLSRTSPTITITEQCGTDSEGNAIYREQVIPNPEYQRLQSQIASLKDRISMLDQSIKQLEALRSVLVSDEKALHNARSVFREGASCLYENSESIINHSERAYAQSDKAIDAIQRYESESCNLLPVHSHTSIPWSSNLNFSSNNDDYFNPYIRKNRGEGSNPSSNGEGNDHERGDSGDSINPIFPFKLKTEPKTFNDNLKKLKWKKINKPHSFSNDLKQTNPKYNYAGKWRVNCQRCVPAYEMRRRDYNVSAYPKELDNDFISYHPYCVWENPEIISAQGTGRERIEEKMQQWGDGARAQIVVTWKGLPSGHTFIAEQRDGKTFFIDPQTGDENVSDYFEDVEIGRTTFCRIDCLNTTDYIEQCCKEN